MERTRVLQKIVLGLSVIVGVASLPLALQGSTGSWFTFVAMLLTGTAAAGSLWQTSRSKDQRDNSRGNGT